MERNRWLTIFKNYRLATLFLILPALVIMELGLLLFSFKNGRWLEKLEVYAYLLNPLNCLKLAKKRRETQQARTVKDKDIVFDFSGKIEHQEMAGPLVEKIVNPLFNLYWQVVKRLIFW